MNLRFLSAITTTVLLASCNPTNKISNDLATALPITSSIDLTGVTNDKAPVVINPGRFKVNTVTYRLPKVIPGTYSVSNFGKYVDDFKAYDYNGNLLPVKKQDENTWVISNAKKLDKITYLVNDTFDIESEGGIGKEQPFSPAGTNIDVSNYVLNLHGFIGYFESLKNNAYKLDVKGDASFVRSSALKESGVKTIKNNIKTTSYFAKRYFDITDNPMMYGDLDVEEFMVGDIKIVLSLYSPNKLHTAKSLKDTFYKMMLAQKAYLGDINSTKRYDIFLYLSEGKATSPKGFGALEHHTSTVAVMPESMPAEALAKSLTDVISHEFFHIVSPLNVHSEDVHYFDYYNPTFSKHLWMYEGVTEYFASLFQPNKGLVTDAEFYNKIMGKINSAAALRPFFNDHVIGDTPIDYNVFFNKVGLEIGKGKVETNFIVMNGVPIIGGDRDRGIIFFSEMVAKNSFWKSQNVQPGDIIKTVNGTALTLANANTVLQDMFRWTVGMPIEVELERNGQKIIVKTNTTQPYTEGTSIVEKSDASAEQKQLKEAWLRG